MKTIVSKLPIILGATLVTGLLYFSSCKREQVNVKKEDPPKETAKQYAAKCSFKPCVVIVFKGHRVGNIDCVGYGICYVQQTLCIPDLVACLDVIIPRCALVDCNNPWNYIDKIVNPIPRYKDYFRKYAVSESTVDFVPIKVTSNIAVLQFYTEVKGTLDRQTFSVPASFDLPKEVAVNLGLRGYTIPAGKYPVVFDEKGKTFNAIVSIK